MRRIKPWIEEALGLPFADALNVSLFVLSVVAIGISLVSLYVAIATKKSADASGEQQQKTLEETRSSISELLGTLKTSNEILKTSTDIARDEQRQLQIQAGNSNRQLSILDEQWRSQSARPDIGAQLRSSSQPSIVLYNHSAQKPVTQGSYQLIMVDIEKPYGFSYQLVETKSTETGWIRPNGSYLPSLLEIIRIPDTPTRPGDRLFGYLTVDCIDCAAHRVYGVYIEYQKIGYYRELSPNGILPRQF